MKKILIHISFVGTAYHGYQVQPNAPTVQQQLNLAAKELFGYDCDIVGCSRTDSGVHANEFCATISQRGGNGIQTTIPISKIPIALNLHLPSDISVRSARYVDEDFHARYSVRSKEYVYVIHNSQLRDPFLSDRCWQYTRQIDEVSLQNMRDAARAFVGTHDFTSYMASNTDVLDAVRTIYDAEVWRDGDMIYFRVRADGFLYNMVRILTGTLIAVAEGKISPSDISIITESRCRSNAGITAPSQGLYLNKVIY